MPPCDPGTVNPPVIPPIPIPGFGLTFAPIQIPFPNISIPTDLLKDLTSLLNGLQWLDLKPNIDNYSKTILELISNLLSQLAPFLSFYNFIMALFNLIMCIIEVLCALLNPFAIPGAIIKLMTQCLPPFLNLFPWLALIAMIIALLLLILALIEYIIAVILAIIAEIIRNILILAAGVSFQDAESTLVAIAKIADLLCLIQNIMAILVALAAIMAIIQALSLFAGGPVCDDAADPGCCPEPACPPFIKAGPITGTKGKLKYYSQIGADMIAIFSSAGVTFPVGFDPAIFAPPPIRTERWQFVDTNVDATFPFSSIITPVFDLSQIPPVETFFWPDGANFDTGTTPSSKMPYNVDMRIFMDPSQFVPSDHGGARFMRIKGTGTIRRPYIGLLNQVEQPDFVSLLDPTLNQGTLNLDGGLVFEDDGYTKYMIDGYQGTLDTFIHKDPPAGVTSPPAVDDGIVFNDIEFTFTPNYGTLMAFNLISVGCMPQVRVEKAVLNAKLVAEDTRAVVQKLKPTPAGVKVPSIGILPNVAGAQQCVLDALAAFRANVSLETAASFQAAVQTCLGDLRDQTQATICGAIFAGVSQFKSTATLNTDVQFTTRGIDVKVILNDAAGNNLCVNLPPTCDVAAAIKGTPTLGTISSFTYDGYSAFDASLTSPVAGSGTLEVSFTEKIFSDYVIRTVAGTTSQIVERLIPYTFIDSVTEPAERRTPSDQAEGNTE